MKYFGTSETIDRIQQFVDRLARKAWEPFHKNEPGFSKDTPANQKYYDYNKNQIFSFWEVVAKSSEAFRGVLMRNAHFLPKQGTIQKAPNGFDIAADDSSWRPFEYDHIIDIIKSNSINSVSDATVKTTAYLQVIAKSMGNDYKRYLFRGQSNINYELKPRLGRIISDEIKAGKIPPPKEPLKLTKRELIDFENFKKAWDKIEKDKLDELTVSEYDENDAGWWVLMQHYVEVYGNGTRMLDVTSSLLFALLFACVKWDTGEIDDKNDGIIYFFIEGQNCRVNDYAKHKLPTATEMYTTEHDVSHMIFNPPHNERSKAQGGGFIWWPKFWESLNISLPYLRIPKENKFRIAKELLSFGVGPKEAVRGIKGMQNEKILRDLINGK